MMLQGGERAANRELINQIKITKITVGERFMMCVRQAAAAANQKEQKIINILSSTHFFASAKSENQNLLIIFSSSLSFSKT